MQPTANFVGFTYRYWYPVAATVVSAISTN